MGTFRRNSNTARCTFEFLIVTVLMSSACVMGIIRFENSTSYNVTWRPGYYCDEVYPRGSDSDPLLCEVVSEFENYEPSLTDPPVIRVEHGSSFSFIALQDPQRRQLEHVWFLNETEVDLEIVSHYVGVLCKARYPTKFETNIAVKSGLDLSKGGGLPKWKDLRSADSRKFIYNTWAGFNRFSAGFVTCRSVTDPHLKTTAYIFTRQIPHTKDTDWNPFVEVREKSLVRLGNSSAFLVPCRTNQMDLRPILMWKIAPEMNFSSVPTSDLATFDWDPKYGFHCDSPGTGWADRSYACVVDTFSKEFVPLPRVQLRMRVVVKSTELNCDWDWIGNRTENYGNSAPEDSHRQTFHKCDGPADCDLRWTTGLLESPVYTYEVPRPRDTYVSRSPLLPHGIFACRDEFYHAVTGVRIPNVIPVKFFRGLDNRIYEVPGTYNSSAQIRMEGSPSSFYLYKSLHHTFACVVATFVINPGSLTFIARYLNGSEEEIDRLNTGIWSEERVDGVEKIEFSLLLCSEITAVKCVASTYDGKWIEEPRSLVVKNVVLPNVDGHSNNSATKILRRGGSNQALVCSLEGDPAPRFKWYYERRELEGQNSSTLQFAVVDDSMAGKYLCVASNDYGSGTYEFNVEVEGSLGKGAVAGIVLAAIVASALFIFAVIFGWKYREANNKLRNLTPEEIEEFLKGRPDAAGGVNDGAEKAVLLPFIQEIKSDDLIVVRDSPLGEGQFGVVYRGFHCGQAVAVKTFKRTVTFEEFRAGLTEIKITAYIGDHPNVVKFIGADISRLETRTVYIVLELSPCGSLYTYLRNIGKLELQEYSNVESSGDRAALIRRLTNFCEQIAFAMEHLESKRMIHGDLATRNVLVFKDDVVKITDFGYSKNLYERSQYVPSKKQLLPWRWASIELLRRMEFSTDSDIWAFGVTCWEIFTAGEVPFIEQNWSEEFLKALESGLRLKKPSLANDRVYEVLCACWDICKEARPRFSALKDWFAEEQRILGEPGSCPEIGLHVSVADGRKSRSPRYVNEPHMEI